MNLMYKLLFFYLFISGIFNNIWSEENSITYISLNGYLGRDRLIEPRAKIEQLNQSSVRKSLLIMEIDSTSGDLNQVLDFAKKIYELKKVKNLNIIVYIHDNAIGPAAILPFLANELYCSLYVTWGDIPLGSEGTLPPNILRNRVRSLIDLQHPHANLLFVLADAMSDPSLQVSNADRTWKIVSGNKRNQDQMISTSGQTLVVNQNQLLELGLVKEVLSLAEFEKKFQLKSIELPSTTSDETPLQIPPKTVEKKLQDYIHFNPDGPNSIGYFYVGDHETAISESTWLYLKQGLEYYKKHPPIFIILELDTPGGEVFAAQKISDAFKEMDTQFNIPIVTFINNWAISAGAMLAYSHSFYFDS